MITTAGKIIVTVIVFVVSFWVGRKTARKEKGHVEPYFDIYRRR